MSSHQVIRRHLVLPFLASLWMFWAATLVLVVTRPALAACPSPSNACFYSSSVPCNNATCSDWSLLGYSGSVTCANSGTGSPVKYDLSVTASAWYNCRDLGLFGNGTACGEGFEDCGTLVVYANAGCTTGCKPSSSLIYQKCKFDLFSPGLCP